MGRELGIEGGRDGGREGGRDGGRMETQGSASVPCVAMHISMPVVV